MIKKRLVQLEHFNCHCTTMDFDTTSVTLYVSSFCVAGVTFLKGVELRVLLGVQEAFPADQKNQHVSITFPRGLSKSASLGPWPTAQNTNRQTLGLSSHTQLSKISLAEGKLLPPPLQKGLLLNDVLKIQFKAPLTGQLNMKP